MKKNDIIELDITALTSEGSGIGRYGGMAVFVPNSAVGDRAVCKVLKVKSSYAYAKIEQMIKPSDDRIEPDCPVYTKCGGCVFRHINYQAELKAKEGFVRDSFKRIGGFDIEPEPILGCKATNRYRNKAQLPMSSDNETPFCGFFSPRSHRVVRFDDCYLQPEIFSDICDFVCEYMRVNNISVYDETVRKGLVRHIYLRQGAHSGEIMLVIVASKRTVAFDSISDELIKKFPMIKTVVLNVNDKDTNVILGCEDICLYGSGRISDTMCDKIVEISAHSFYQINTSAAENVYKIAADYAQLTGKETLLDLYCGIGTVGLSMADKVKKLIGVEVIEDAVENAKKNAAENGVENSEFICGDAGKIASLLEKRGERPDVIVVDPPRKGCDELTLNSIAKMSPERVVYISCNHATCARDIKYLSQMGYELQRYRPCDLFPRTNHVETVVLLSKVRG